MSNPSKGWMALLTGANAVRTLALAGGVALHAVNLYIGTTILPSVVRDIGGLDYYAWNTALFVIASIISAALASQLLEKFGPRAAYVAGALVFALGSLACALAPSMPVMLGGRFVQGFGGGLLLALPYAMIRLVYDEALWPRAIAVLSGMWGVATLLGPAIGGVFAQMDAWRLAFGSLVPAAGLFTLLALAVIPGRDTREKVPSPVPWVQLVLLASAVIAVSAGSVSRDAVWNIAGVLSAALLAASLFAVEKRASTRLLPKDALRGGAALGALYVTMALLAVTVTCTEIFAPLFFQVLHAKSPLASGYLAAIMSAGWTLGSVMSSGATGGRITLAIRTAPAVALASMLALAAWVPTPSNGSWQVLVPICLAMLALGFAVGIAWPHLSTRVLQIAPPGEENLAASSIMTVQLFATAMGAALAGLVANLGGLSSPGGVQGTAGAALALFGGFAVAPLLCLFTARHAASADTAAIPKPVRSFD
ncbi:MAG TPA: MFS transporter [Polaromonas sp.]|uniref:MFS transporter n=1 Tax=Polaromonas sp. TaxID=1869339 RepID=UPI002D4E3196|nr:MFS transporter [Polaromonas sp.]HYW58574.1 MFS transporter [Polaromonas sp.]